MSKLHGEEDEGRMGRGELRNPGDRGDQPGQGADRKPSVEDRERETRAGHELEPGVGPGESQQG